MQDAQHLELVGDAAAAPSRAQRADHPEGLFSALGAERTNHRRRRGVPGPAGGLGMVDRRGACRVRRDGRRAGSLGFGPNGPPWHLGDRRLALTRHAPPPASSVAALAHERQRAGGSIARPGHAHLPVAPGPAPGRGARPVYERRPPLHCPVAQRAGGKREEAAARLRDLGHDRPARCPRCLLRRRQPPHERRCEAPPAPAARHPLGGAVCAAQALARPRSRTRHDGRPSRSSEDARRRGPAVRARRMSRSPGPVSEARS